MAVLHGLHIRGRGTFRSPAVEAAFAAVPRHLFLPGMDLATAYAPQVVVTKRAPDGSALSSASHPNMVATMLEQLDLQPGHRVLEIGAATGINAALLAELTGPSGAVATVEIDSELAARARTALTAAGYDQVQVVCGDGAFGHPDLAPYDRIIVTAGAWDIPAAWWQQLTPHGRMVVPLRLHGSGLTRSIAFHRHADTLLISDSVKVCGFVPLRGASDSAAHTIQLADDITLNLAANTGSRALGRALTHPAHQIWTGIMIGDTDPVEHLDLWLATSTDHFARLSLTPTAHRHTALDPAPRWAGATLHDGDATLADHTAQVLHR
ncbi:methyltransferase, FxLD system [Actinomadura sp. NBRC 104412]|uniref:methyltransferase, FxLD system n=1 Tax=Actinomadura sp. NBRC 104412 TaxID=3032203 RepID=UPI0025524035|nr:methyltransferase, FxLD system [Actinomadura sp. NBRC 104412]